MQIRRPSPLSCQPLEPREVPSAVLDTFEASPFPFAPVGWGQWSSNQSSHYQISRTTAVSGIQSLAIHGTVNVESRIWRPVAMTGDVRLQLTVRGDTPAPILLFGRGTLPGSLNSSYVGIVLNPGGTLELIRATNGTREVLKTMTPISPTAAWLTLTLELLSGQASVRVQRLDTQQFLNASGHWQTPQALAISQPIPPGTGAGLVGIGRLPGAYGTAFVDDFSAENLVQPPASSLPTPPTGQSPTTPPAQSPPASQPQAPPAQSLPTPPPQSPPSNTPEVRKFGHIRIAQLAYASQKVTAVEEALFGSTVDLVVANPNFLERFEAVDAATPKLIYSNVTNLYEERLSSWIAHADRNGVDREAAFYHVAQATPFKGSSPSSMPVTWFWNAARYSLSGNGLTNVTRPARGLQSAGVSFGLPNEALALGQLEKFREMNVTLSKGAGSGYGGVWEYASAVDSGGRAIAWKPLPVIENTTSGLTQSGRITFDPPSDWVHARLGSSGERLFYVRFRVTSGTAASMPVANRIHGRDYVNANGTNQGVIPAFDQTADQNGDGYLNDAEYALRQPGHDARFIYESRLFYPYYGQMRFVVNPTHEAVKQWEGEYHADYLAANPHADGLFLDNTNGKLPFAGTAVLEPVANYNAQNAAVVAGVKQAIGGRAVVVNTSGGGAQAFADAVTRAAGIAFEEFLLRPTVANWSAVNDVAEVVKRRLNADPAARVILDSHPGSTSMLDARTRLGVLSYYYLLADPDRTYLMFFGGFAPSSSWQNRWVPAAAVDVGKPRGAMTTFASGFDPQNAQLQFRVYSREYDNALILFKPLSYTLGKGTGTLADATATTHALPAAYRMLNADGTLGAVVTSVTLRNGEGVVLMKQ